MTYKSTNFRDKFSLFDEQWQPKVVAEMNEYQFKLVKLQGDFIWHDHKDTDEAFIVMDGELRIDLNSAPQQGNRLGRFVRRAQRLGLPKQGERLPAGTGNVLRELVMRRKLFGGLTSGLAQPSYGVVNGIE